MYKSLINLYVGWCILNPGGISGFVINLLWWTKKKNTFLNLLKQNKNNINDKLKTRDEIYLETIKMFCALSKFYHMSIQEVKELSFGEILIAIDYINDYNKDLEKSTKK